MKWSIWFRWLMARLYHIWGGMYRYWGNRYGDRDAHFAAAENFSKAMESDPKFARAYLDRGILYWRELNHPRKAILDLTKAEELDPSLTEARFNRGVAHQQLREYDKAIADFRAYLSMGDHPYWREYAQKMIGELVEWTGGIEEAI